MEGLIIAKIIINIINIMDKYFVSPSEGEPIWREWVFFQTY